MTNLSTYYPFKDNAIVYALSNSLIKAVRNVQKNTDLMHLLQLQLKQKQQAICKKINKKEIPALVRNLLIVDTTRKENSLLRQHIDNDKELPKIIADTNLVTNKYISTATKGDIIDSKKDVKDDKQVNLNTMLINTTTENLIAEIKNATNKHAVIDALNLKQEQNGVSAFAEVPLQKYAISKNIGEIALKQNKSNSDVAEKARLLQTVGIGNEQNSVLELPKFATETQNDAERNKVPVVINSTVANINAGISILQSKGIGKATNLNAPLLPKLAQPLSIARKTEDVKNSQFVQMPAAENRNIKKETFKPAPINTNYETGKENTRAGVMNIHLNAPMIGNFTIATNTAREEGLGDFKRKVEEVLLDILNSANVK